MVIAETYIDTFWNIAEQGIKLVVPILAIWLIMKLIRSLILRRGNMQYGKMEFTEENIEDAINFLLDTPTNELCYLPKNTGNIFRVATIYDHNTQKSGSAPYQYKTNAAFYRNTVSFQINEDGSITPTSAGEGEMCKNGNV